LRAFSRPLAVVMTLALALGSGDVARAQESVVFALVEEVNGNLVQKGWATQVDDAGLFLTAKHLLAEPAIGPYAGQVKVKVGQNATATISSVVAAGSYSVSAGNYADDWILFEVAQETDDDKLILALIDGGTFASLTPAFLESAQWNEFTAAGEPVFWNNSRWGNEALRGQNDLFVAQGCSDADPLFMGLGLTYAAGRSGTPLMGTGNDSRRVVGVSSRWAVQQELFSLIEILRSDRNNLRAQAYLDRLQSEIVEGRSWQGGSANVAYALEDFNSSVLAIQRYMPSDPTVVISPMDEARLQDALVKLQNAADQLQAAARQVSIAPAACILNFFVKYDNQFNAESYAALRPRLRNFVSASAPFCRIESEEGARNAPLTSEDIVKFDILQNFKNGITKLSILDVLALDAWVTKNCNLGGKLVLLRILNGIMISAFFENAKADDSEKGPLVLDLIDALSKKSGTQTVGTKTSGLTISYSAELQGTSSGSVDQVTFETPLLPWGGSDAVPHGPQSPIWLPAGERDRFVGDDFQQAIQNDLLTARILEAVARRLRSDPVDGLDDISARLANGLETDAALLASGVVQAGSINTETGLPQVSSDVLTSANEIVLNWLSERPASVINGLPVQYDLAPSATVGDYLSLFKERNVLLQSRLPNISVSSESLIIPRSEPISVPTWDFLKMVPENPLVNNLESLLLERQRYNVVPYRLDNHVTPDFYLVPQLSPSIEPFMLPERMDPAGPAVGGSGLTGTGLN
jgi:hypothetical protein